MITERGEVVLALGKAAALHQDFPAGVEDTPQNRHLWLSIQAEVEAMELGGITPDIPPE